ncbi:MAG: Bifunctional sulfatase/alpha-L-rhamnosidase [Chroococcopsis gigantea SAG 12.99]|jgi:arylsulfatase A-like enzyme|nr:sulfatase [Chlorogloea purpurea SAG 13.99]MDV3001745.1 Bifunctional sulfatase/alpha-L-rhamnosidase [Chroococcopsis gigantea SAG 12.99]
MKRRSFLQGTALGIGTGLLGSFVFNNSRSGGANNSRPNIIILVADDMRWDCLGIMGDRVINTPTLEQLAKEGTLFRNNFVTTSICPTSRASIFTGQYARRHKIWDFNIPLTAEQFNLSYMGQLEKSGYKIAFIGKWGLGGKLPVDEFNYWRGYEGQGQYFAPDRQEHLTDLDTSQALKFIKITTEQPFCISLSYKAPHAQDGAEEPFQPQKKFASEYEGITIPAIATNTEKHFQKLPQFLQNSEGRKRWIGRFDEAKYTHSVKQYYRLISGIDDSIAQIISALKQKNILQNTWIIFTSDNGFFLGDRGLSDKWIGYEESIRTPLIIKPPTLPGKQLIEAMTLNIDIAPTILAIAGLEPPSVMQGKSLLGLMGNETTKLREEWLYEYLCPTPNIPKSEGIRTENYKYIKYLVAGPDTEMLYDLTNDPFEENNLINEPGHQGKLQQMRNSLNQYRQQVS